MLPFSFRLRRTAHTLPQQSFTATAPVPAAPQPCFHCGLPLPPTVRDWVSFDGSARPVCCAACAAVAAWIVMSGHGDYYTGRARLAADGAQGGGQDGGQSGEQRDGQRSGQ